MKSFIRIVVLYTILMSLFACKNNENIDAAITFPAPGLLEQQSMEKSWLEYIIKVNNIPAVINLDIWNAKLAPAFVIKKIKSFAKNQYVITLDKKTKYKVVYQSLMPLSEIESVQPNFHYQSLQPELKIDVIDTR